MNQNKDKKEETHTACNERIEKEGGKACCCYCVPHEGCKLSELAEEKECICNDDRARGSVNETGHFSNCPQPKPDWEEEFRTKFLEPDFYADETKVNGVIHAERRFLSFADPKEVKSFISKVEHDTREVCLEEIEKNLPEKMTERNMMRLSTEVGAETEGEVIMWNECRSKILSLIQSMKHDKSN